MGEGDETSALRHLPSISSASGDDAAVVRIKRAITPSGATSSSPGMSGVGISAASGPG